MGSKTLGTPSLAFEVVKIDVKRGWVQKHKGQFLLSFFLHEIKICNECLMNFSTNFLTIHRNYLDEDVGMMVEEYRKLYSK